MPETPQNAGAGEWRGKGAIAIREVPVWGRRPMKSIGVEETKLDSAILKENIALSMADVLTFNTSIFRFSSSSTAARPSPRYRSAARVRRIRR